MDKQDLLEQIKRLSKEDIKLLIAELDKLLNNPTKEEYEKDEEGNTKGFIIDIKNKPFTCSCGCNVFSRYVNEIVYECNSCGVLYKGEDRS